MAKHLIVDCRLYREVILAEKSLRLYFTAEDIAFIQNTKSPMRVALNPISVGFDGGGLVFFLFIINMESTL